MINPFIIALPRQAGRPPRSGKRKVKGEIRNGEILTFTPASTRPDDETSWEKLAFLMTVCVSVGLLERGARYLRVNQNLVGK